MLSTRPERHRSWQLFVVSRELAELCGATLLELALRRVAAEHSESPMYLVFPAWRISSRAGMDSVRGVSGQISDYP